MSDRSDLVVRGGTVVTPEGRAQLDVCVLDGRIVALHPAGSAGVTKRSVDADGLLVLPGMVDTHVHLMDPGDPTREDFPTGTRAAAAHGVTTIVEHTHGWPVTDTQRFHEKLAHVRERSHVDFGLAAHAVPANLDQVVDLWTAGVTFFKFFTCTTHGIDAITSENMLALLESVARLDARCLVHCEDELITAWNERALREAGRVDPGVVPAWRSREAELLAVNAVALAAEITGACVVVAHASSREVLDIVDRHRARRAPVLVESCPQYFFLEESDVLAHGALRKFTPPARLRSEHDQRAMWNAFNAGAIDVLSTDHAPSTREQKAEGDIWSAHFGLPGLDSTLPLMLDAALDGRTSVERVTDAYARRPARIYRLAGKGEVRPGFDADLVLVDPEAETTLSDQDVISKAGWTPYAGRRVRGAVQATFLRGLEVYSGGQLGDGPARGRFLAGPGARHRVER